MRGSNPHATTTAVNHNTSTPPPPPSSPQCEAQVEGALVGDAAVRQLAAGLQPPPAEPQHLVVRWDAWGRSIGWLVGCASWLGLRGFKVKRLGRKQGACSAAVRGGGCCRLPRRLTLLVLLAVVREGVG
jgi:hypothetical protein